MIDTIKTVIRGKTLSLAIIAFLAFFGIVTTVIAILFFMFGAAEGLSKALTVDLWMGFLIIGLSFLLPVFAVLLFFSPRSNMRVTRKKAAQIIIDNERSEKIIEMADIERWAQNHPYYFISSAAAVGFGLSSALFPTSPKENEVTPPFPPPHTVGARDSVVAMMLVLAEDLLREVAIPYLKEQLHSQHQTEGENSEGYQ